MHYNNYVHAISENPSNVEAWFNQGLIMHKSKRYPEALVSYDKVIELDKWNGKSIL